MIPRAVSWSITISTNRICWGVRLRSFRNCEKAAWATARRINEDDLGTSRPLQIPDSRIEVVEDFATFDDQGRRAHLVQVSANVEILVSGVVVPGFEHRPSSEHALE